jgi:hypothetical protein
VNAGAGEYRREADVLDARVLAAIADPTFDDAAFDALACALFAHQFRWNAPYATYARSLGIDEARMPTRAVDISAVPAAAFKEAALTTAGAQSAAIWFETSGTTQGRGGKHYLETSVLYDAALLAGFDRALLDDGARLRYLLLVPDPRERPHSSLGHMMAVIARVRGDACDGWYLHDDALDVERFVTDARATHDAGVPVCVATTAFALVTLLDELATRGIALRFAPGSRVMETGGFKGRTRIVAREDLYARTAAAFGIDESAIVAEYGMTELSSQYYDSHASRNTRTRVKTWPPWLRPIIVDPQGRPVAPGIVGAIRHIDCANRSSVVAIETEDLGALTDAGLVLVGRERGAELRGCSLDAEDLASRA